MAGMVRMGVALAEDGEVGGPLDLINGLPVHPLVVHAAVVLVPLAALGLIAMALWQGFSRKHGWLVVAVSAAAVVFCALASESGEPFEERVGDPRFDHADLGEQMPVLAGVLFAAAAGMWLLDRLLSERPRRAGGLRIVIAAAAVLVALLNVFWIYRVGDSGAKSVWQDEVSGATDGLGEEGPSDD